jgi:cytochrome P450
MVAHARRWADARRAGEVLPLREAMMQLTLDVVGETMFGAADAAAAGDVRELLDAGLRLFGPLTLPVARWMEQLPIPAARRFTRARDRLDQRIAALLVERRREAAAGVERDDLLSLLLAAQQGPDGPASGGLGGLDDRWARDETMTIFVAGHETTASALTWAWWLLARHPEAERRLHDELDQVLGDRDPTAADLPHLPYAAAVFAESLRLWPTVPMVFRRALEPHPVGPWTVQPGEVVALSQWVVQRDARWWPDPQRFRPERWLPEAPVVGTDGTSRASRPRLAYFPFGAGARVCIGEHFAAQEGALLLATIARRWRVLPLAETLPRLDPTLGTRPPDGLLARVEPRTLGRDVPRAERRRAPPFDSHVIGVCVAPGAALARGGSDPPGARTAPGHPG